MTVEVRYLGHLGNNLFEYALGRIIAQELGLSLQCVPASDMPSWGKVERTSGIVDRLNHCHDRFVDVHQSLSGRTVEFPQSRYVMGEISDWTGQGINLDYLLRQGGDQRIVLHGYFQRTEYYHPYREHIRRWYRFTERKPAISFHPEDVFMHLRQSLDMFMLDRAIDLSYYRNLLAGMNFGKVYICGLGLNAKVREALAEFNPVYLDMPAIDTLYLMTQANRIVLANSTFSWWGAYLSQAHEIYYPRPVRGFWGKDRSDVDLEVPEERYRYIDDVAVQFWRPFRLARRARLAADWLAGVGGVIIARADGGATKLAIPPELEAFSHWLAGLDSVPFGMHEIYCHNLSATGRRSAIKVLLALQRLGLLDAEQLALESVANLYGVSLD